ncbi:hypothetical protein FPZ12_038175 [Amycolatopsis acidicola]|uniref:Uncharacterized protein n=1 Tax=Amycolatopsis acidicola TaxID=2596893 RepID=A0A5N0UNH0_9PSEU|nr:hypothetical protein [Amycolatopsis acidicola]KAA9151757.1 hypothetical protein FPZ12_038175 [Amycolatopsis acidicola]
MTNKARRWVAAVLLGVALPLGPAVAEAAPAQEPMAAASNDDGGAWGLLGLFGLLGLLGLIPRKQPGQLPPTYRPPQRRANPNVASPLDNYPVMADSDEDAEGYYEQPAPQSYPTGQGQPQSPGREWPGAGQSDPRQRRPWEQAPGRPAQPGPQYPGRGAGSVPGPVPRAQDQGSPREATQYQTPPSQATPQTGDTPEGGHRRL